MQNNLVSNALLCFSLLFTGAQKPAFPSTIDFENQCPGGVQTAGPCSSLFANAGNAQSLNVLTAIGSVNFEGGVLLDNATNLPADETVIYGTAGNAADIGVFPGSGFTNPLTITFPAPITNFYLDVLNGNTMNVDYHMADNQGNSADFLIAPNLSGGLKTIGFAATGTEVTISAATGQSTAGGMTWDFLIDNVHFDQPLPSGSAPEPGSLALIGIGLAMLALGRIRKNVVRPRVERGSRVLLASLAGILLVTSASAAATTSFMPPALILSDNYGNSVTIDSTGTATCMGACTTTMPATASSGSVTWAGTLGVFTFSVAGGQSKPALPYAQVNLGLRVTTGVVTGGGGGATNATLNAKWGDVGFDGTGPITMSASYSLSGDVSATYTGYVDNTNALFGTETTVGAIGPTTFSSTATATGPGPTSEPFSMTEAVTATMGPNSSFTLAGFSLAATPLAQLTLACPSASGQVGVPYDSHLMASGGVAPYVFSTVGSLAPGLALNSSTGEISGTPITAGIFSFAPQVMDASGNPAQNTVQSECSITVTTPPAPLTLACPTATDEEGLPYSSSLVATGGILPYTFSLASGSLPPGLSLNPSTGAISGIDSTAAGSFSFTAKVVGSSGNAAANAALINCLVVAQAPVFNLRAVDGTTPQSVVVGTTLGTPLAVKVTDGTGKAVSPPGFTVRFSVATSANKPGGAFAGGAANDVGTLNTAPPAPINAGGIAQAPALTANTVTGTYSARATLLDATGASVKSVTFTLTNTAGPPVNLKATAGDGQSTIVGTQFRNPLTVNVTDRFGNAVPNWPVSFGAPIVPAPGLPAPAPTATFVSNNSPTATVNTDKNGNASSPLVKANTVPGSYAIKAQVSVPLPPANLINLILSATFKMTNLVGPPAKIVPVLPANDPTVVAGPPITLFAKVKTNYTTLVVQITDKYDNPLSGQTVKFQSTNAPGQPGATFAGNNSRLGIFCTPPMTGADGTATADPLTANGNTGAFYVSIAVTNTNLTKSLKLINRDTLAPNVVGMTQAAATKAITGATLKLGTVTKQSSNMAPAGIVISQDPPAGRPVNTGDAVDLTVSSGKPKS